ncbi:hypothetical protein BLAT2472_50204 [Burkholderia latens]
MKLGREDSRGRRSGNCVAVPNVVAVVVMELGPRDPAAADGVVSLCA